MAFAICGCLWYDICLSFYYYMMDVFRLISNSICALFSSPFVPSPKNHSTVSNVVSVVWVGSNPSVIAKNVACVFQYRYLNHINVLRISIRIIVPSVVKTCSRPVNHLKTYRVDTPFTPTVSVNSPVLIIVVPFVRKLWSVNKVWPPLGRPEHGILPNIPCPLICNVWWISCAMTVKPKHPTCNGTFWVFNAPPAVHSIPSWNKC